MTQIVANILFSASMIFLVGISFSLIYSTARFFHFAHAAVITAGAYACFALSQWLSLPMSISVLFALAAGTGIGWCLELVVYRPLRHKCASSLILLLASLGLYIVLQNGVSMLFGDDTKIIAGAAVASSFDIFTARVTGIQATAIVIAVVVLIAKIFLVDRSRVGLSLRAVANSPELAITSGINFDKTMGTAFCMGSCIGAVAGLFRAFDVGMTPTMGLPMLLLGVVAVVLGGNGKTMGVAVASILLAAFQQTTAWQLGTQWEETVPFFLLLFFLFARPQGLFGRISGNKTV